MTERRTVRQTYRCTKIHKRLVEQSRFASCGVGGGKSRLKCAFGRILSDVYWICGDACSNAQEIPIDRRTRQTVGKGGDGACRISTDPGKGKQRIKIAGKYAAMFADNDLCGAF